MQVIPGGDFVVSSIIFIAIFLVITLFVNFKNRMSWIFSGYFLGIGILLFSAVMYISKFSVYHNFTQFDYYTYLRLNEIKLSPSSISRLFIVGIAIIMLSSLFFLFTLRNIKNYAKIILFIPILTYVIINDPLITYKAFLAINAFDRTFLGTVAEKVMKYNADFGIYILIFYMIIPLYALFAYCRKTKIILKLQNSLLSLIHLAIIYAIIIFFYVTGPFKTSMLKNVDLLYFPTKTINWSFYTAVQPVIIFLLLIILFITVYFKPFSNLTIITSRQMKRNAHILNENIGLIFHSYKNLFFAIERLSHQGSKLVEKNPALAKENLDDIHSLSQTALDSVTRKLNMLSNVKCATQIINIKDCIDLAVQRVSASEKIKIIREVLTDDLMIKGDAYHLTECFFNMLSNSIDALKIKNEKHPFIKIKIFSEDNLICVEILDNGCGIKHNDISKIFRMFYSTKQSNENWGVGLNYVEKVLNLYSDRIYVKSKTNVYTWFQIVLPLHIKGGNRFGKNKSSNM